MRLADRIRVARGQQAPDLVLKAARVVNVFTNDVQLADVAVADGRVVGLGAYDGPLSIDLGGAYVLPGLIDGHLHIESTLLSPAEFARAVVPRGVTSVVVDPHEIGNVLGADGIRLLLRATADLPLNVFVNVPSCVPASAMESGGHVLEAADMAPLLGHARVVGIAEVMNFPGLLAADPRVLAKVELGLAAGLPVDGHAPGVRGKDLCAYVAAGVDSDHETTRADEAEEKLRLGMWLMVREGSTEHNLDELLPVLQKLRPRRAMLVTDDRAPTDLRDEGHLDHALRRAIARGLDPVWAVALATINPAERFRIHDLGAVAPGFRADLMVVDDLHTPAARLVFKDGVLVARDGQMVSSTAVSAVDGARSDLSAARGSVRIAPLDAAAFELPAAGPVRVIGLVPGQIVTQHLRVEEPRVQDGRVVADPERDLLKLAVVERHRASGRIGVGLVRGFGLQRGALASSVAHDAHNIGVVGVGDADMRRAVEAVAELEGGLVVVSEGQVRASLPLPIGGLMSDLPFETVAARLEQVEQAARELGCRAHRPFMALSFLALSVIPKLKLTDRGLVDVEAWQLVPLGA